MNIYVAVFFIGLVVCTAIFAGGIFIGIDIERARWLSANAKIEAQDTKAAAKGNQDLSTTDQKIDVLRNQTIPTVHYEKDTDCPLPSAAVFLLKRD